jgi:hypothetical protein
MDTFAVIDQLVGIITSGVADIKRTHATAGGVPAPNLDEPYTESTVEQKTAVQTTLVIAAASQLIRTLQKPASVVKEIVMGVRYWTVKSKFLDLIHIQLGAQTAAVSAVAKLHLPELIREAGVQVEVSQTKYIQSSHVKTLRVSVSSNWAKLRSKTQQS